MSSKIERKVQQFEVALTELLSDEEAIMAVNQSVDDFADRAELSDVIVERQENYTTKVVTDKEKGLTIVKFEITCTAPEDIDIADLYAEVMQ